jgi:hypothetical protein
MLDVHPLKQVWIDHGDGPPEGAVAASEGRP